MGALIGNITGSQVQQSAQEDARGSGSGGAGFGGGAAFGGGNNAYTGNSNPLSGWNGGSNGTGFGGLSGAIGGSNPLAFNYFTGRPITPSNPGGEPLWTAQGGKPSTSVMGNIGGGVQATEGGSAPTLFGPNEMNGGNPFGGGNTISGGGQQGPTPQQQYLASKGIWEAGMPFGGSGVSDWSGGAPVPGGVLNIPSLFTSGAPFAGGSGGSSTSRGDMPPITLTQAHGYQTSDAIGSGTISQIDRMLGIDQYASQYDRPPSEGSPYKSAAEEENAGWFPGGVASSSGAPWRYSDPNPGTFNQPVSNGWAGTINPGYGPMTQQPGNTNPADGIFPYAGGSGSYLPTPMYGAGNPTYMMGF